MLHLRFVFQDRISALFFLSYLCALCDSVVILFFFAIFAES